MSHSVLPLDNAYDYFIDSVFLIDSNADYPPLNSSNTDEIIFYSQNYG